MHRHNRRIQGILPLELIKYKTKTPEVDMTSGVG